MTDHGSCSECAFFDDHAKAGTPVAKDGGLCRYNPPVTQPGPSEHGLWPVVSVSDWCGHFTNDSTPRVAAE